MSHQLRFGLFGCVTMLVASIALGSPSVSLIELIANPTAQDAREVSVYGVFQFESGTAALFLSKDDARHSIGPNAIGLDLNPRSRIVSRAGNLVEPRRLNGHYVRVLGTVDSRGAQALARWRVLLKEVTEVVELSK